MGNLSFNVANQIVKIAGGEVVRVPLDKDGIDVDAIEKVCQKESIRAVYILPHHHHPTTPSVLISSRLLHRHRHLHCRRRHRLYSGYGCGIIGSSERICSGLKSFTLCSLSLS